MPRKLHISLSWTLIHIALSPRTGHKTDRWIDDQLITKHASTPAIKSNLYHNNCIYLFVYMQFSKQLWWRISWSRQRQVKGHLQQSDLSSSLESRMVFARGLKHGFILGYWNIMIKRNKIKHYYSLISAELCNYPAENLCHSNVYKL